MVPRNEPQNLLPRPTFRRLPSNSKASLVSPTPSVEGDDEQSASEPNQSSRGSSISDLEANMTRRQHEDEDVRPTSQKELAGWYSYGWAAEVFAICAMGSFLPITLEQLARDQGVRLDDKKTPCSTSWPTGNNQGSDLVLSRIPHRRELAACIIRIGGAEINTASFAMYTFSISVFVQSLLIISMSGAADHGRFRKLFLLVFGFTGAVALMLFITVVPKIYLFGAILAIIANTCFGASFVLLNSFLPVLVRHHPSLQNSRGNTDERRRLLDNDDLHQHDYGTDATHTSGSTLIPSNSPDQTPATENKPADNSEELKLSTRISSNGIGIGYIAGLLVQIACIFVVVATQSTTFSLRLVLMIVGLWWFIFTIPAALWLRPRPGPPLPANFSENPNALSYVIYAWKSLFRTIRQARRLKDIVIFLAAWFLLSDSIATVSGTAVLFAKTNLGMKVSELGLINVIATIAGVIGAFYWSSFSRFFGLRASQTIIACVCLFELIPLYGLLGFIPAVKRLGVIGLQQPIEMYFLGAIYGFVLGGLSSYCRAFFGELIPPGFEAAFYALYAITDKGSSIFGPAIVGAITDRYGDIRPAFVFLAVLISLPLPLLLLVDVDRGKAEAASLALELEGKQEDLGEHASSAPRVTVYHENGQERDL